MTVEFRCEKCGKLLSVDAAPESKVKCPYCKARVLVPAGVASLPRPQVPGQPPPPPQQGAQGEEEVLEEEPVGDDALMGVMATVMPWVISLFFHVGLLVILAFITIVMLRAESVADYDAVIAQDLSKTPGGQLSPGEANNELKAKSRHKINQNKWSKRDSTIPLDSVGETKSRISVYGIAGGSAGGQSARFGMTPGGAGIGPKSRFYGTPGNAYHIVYVVDRSGSMLDTFDEVRNEMFRSITRLNPAQTFHVIFFASGDPKENPPRRLVQADVPHKREAVHYLRKIQPHGQTDMVPALVRAFKVLGQTPNSKRGKLIYLLTDAEFDSAKVLARIRELNPRREVHINTILHHYRSPEAMKTLRQIADENGGRFKFVEPNE
ncbi:hypothetical protein LCGC14_2064630 [marine sediment metagenome]|uniref:VWFA domain-containing protein n=1 Tax=marine sediment metagenome TaxID=412755 RepID=A0A0F9EKB3_9ZZZZ